MFIILLVSVTSSPLHIGAFNLRVYGENKSSMNSTVSIIAEVRNQCTCVVYNHMYEVRISHS